MKLNITKIKRSGAKIAAIVTIFYTFVFFPVAAFAQEVDGISTTDSAIPVATEAISPTNITQSSPTPSNTTDTPTSKITEQSQDSNLLTPTPILTPVPDGPVKTHSLIDNMTNILLKKISDITRKKTKFGKLTKDNFSANDPIMLPATLDQKTELTIKVKDATDTEYILDATRETIDGEETLVIMPPRDLKPGKYTLTIKDDTDQTYTDEFYWGVLTLNTNKATYLPHDTAHIALAVLDENGEMVCDADVSLSIEDPDGTITKHTTHDGTIKINDICSKKIFTLTPDYETQYVPEKVGDYKLTLIAVTKNGTYQVEDGFDVKESVQFDVERTSATRLYPPLTYPMYISVTAQQDFEGTIIDVVPESFDITQASDGRSFTEIKKAEEQAPEAQVLGATTTPQDLIQPFDGYHPITLGFGEQYGIARLVSLITNSNDLKGHDGIDFDMPVGTPIKATDMGTVTYADDGDYGKTVIIEHSWGESYYGHLSSISVKKGDSVAKGFHIGDSGDTGESTGPHLHFSIKPQQADEQNGYKGMVDPKEYVRFESNEAVLGAATHTVNYPTKQIRWDIHMKKGETVKLGYAYKTPPQSPELYKVGKLMFEEWDKERNSSDKYTAEAPQGHSIVGTIIYTEGRFWQLAIDAGNGDGMLAYDEDQAVNTTPHYRRWGGVDLSAEGQMQDEETSGEESNFTIIEASPARDEYIRGSLTSSGHLDIQVWNGSSWVDGTSAPTNGEFTTGIGTTNDAMRGFDIAYEDSSGDALVVYESSSTADKALKYRTWNGSSWSGESSLDYTAVAEGGSNDVSVWVELEHDYGSDSILLGWQDKTGLGYYGARWDGSAFQNVTLINGAGVAVARQGFDLAWEGTSGDGMIAYITGTTTDFSTYTNAGGFVDGNGSVNPAIAQAKGGWLILSGDPNSNYIAMIDLMAPTTNPTTTSDLYVDMWNGTDWTTITTPTADTDINTYGFSQGADVVWEQASSDRALFVWRDGTTSETALRYMVFDISVGQFLAIDDDGAGANVCNLTGTATNQQVTSLTNAENSNGPCTGLGTWAGTVSGINLNADPGSRKIMLLGENETTLDIRPEAQLWNGVDGGTWLTQTTNMGAFETDASTGVLASATLPSMPYDFAFNATGTTISISGTCQQFDRSTDCSDDGANAITVAVNGTIKSQTDATVDGSWTIASVAKPASGDVVTIFINGETTASERANAITKYDGTGDITGVKLYQRHLTIGSDDNQTLTNTNLSDYDFSVSGSDADIFFEIDSGDDLTMDPSNLYTDDTLYTLASNTYQPGSGGTSFVTAQNIIIAASSTLTGNGNTFDVKGSWTNNGTYTCSSNTVKLRSTGTSDTIKSSSNAFCNLRINNYLMSYHKLDEGTGSTANDASGEALTGTVSGTPAWTTTTPNTSYYGADPGASTLAASRYISMGDVSAVNFDSTDAISVSAWIKTTSDSGMTIASKQLQAGNSYKGWMVQTGTGGFLFWQIINTVTTNHLEVRTTADLNYEIGGWHHVVTTYDGSKTPGGVHIYFDNSDKALTTNVNTLTGSTTNTAPFSIGSRNNAEQFWTGDLDDVRVYKRVLSATEVGELYAGTHPTEGTYTLSDALDVNGDLTISTGGIDQSSGNYGINVGGNYINVANMTSRSAATLTMDAASGTNKIQSDPTINNLIMNDGGGSATYSVDKQRLISAGDITITGGTFTPGATCNAASVCDITLGDDFTNNDIFTASTGTVTVNDAAQTSTFSYGANTTFNNFTVATNAKPLVFDKDFRTIVSGTLTLTGTACANRITLDSEQQGTQFELNATGTKAVTYVDVEDSNAITAITATGSKNSGNNTNWTIDDTPANTALMRHGAWFDTCSVNRAFTW